MLPELILLAAAAQGPENVSRSPDLSSCEPFVTHDARGRALAVWEESRRLDRERFEHALMYAVFWKEAWSKPEAVHQGLQAHLQPRVFSGVAPAVVWAASDKEGGAASFFVARRTELGWKVERFLEGAIRPAVPYMAGCVGVDRDGAGSFHVAYTGSGDRSDLHYVVIGERAGEPRRVAGAERLVCHSPSVAATGGGVAIAWARGNPKLGDRLFLSVGRGNPPLETSEVPTRERFAFCPRLAYGGKSLVLVWGERDAFGYPCRSKHFMGFVAGDRVASPVEFPYKPDSLDGDRLTLNVCVDIRGRVHAVGSRRLSGPLGSEREFAHTIWENGEWRASGARRDKRPSGLAWGPLVFSLDPDGLCDVLWSEAKGIPSGLREIWHVTTP
jgi:hypothetical protein